MSDRFTPEDPFKGGEKPKSWWSDPFGTAVPGQCPTPAIVLGWLQLATGIWCIFLSLFYGAALSLCCMPFILAAFQFITGVVGTVHGTRMVTNNRMPPSGGLTVAYIVMLITCDIVTFVSGIVQVVLRNNEQVRAWYRLP